MRKPGRWTYGLAVLIPILGCLVTALIVYRTFPSLPGTFEAEMNIDNLTQVVVPGSHDITFENRGAHAVYYEYRSIVDGVTYASSRTPPALACTLTSKATGTDVAVVPDYVETNTYSTHKRERVGVLIRSVTIDRPGTYTFSCRYVDGSGPQVVLAVGPNLVWQFFGIAARTIGSAGCGLAVLLASGSVASLVALAIARQRRRSRQAAPGVHSAVSVSRPAASSPSPEKGKAP
jgi:hypothetical protein